MRVRRRYARSVSATHREDSFDNMKVFAATHSFTFPYVIDDTEETARTYGAKCTPVFFGFNAQAETGQGPVEQTPSMGCSIKWRG
jgi:hypothetical protein